VRNLKKSKIKIPKKSKIKKSKSQNIHSLKKAARLDIPEKYMVLKNSSLKEFYEDNNSGIPSRNFLSATVLSTKF
jgi:hypothetical protein